jgi:hypothetical protein
LCSLHFAERSPIFTEIFTEMFTECSRASFVKFTTNCTNKNSRRLADVNQTEQRMTRSNPEECIVFEVPEALRPPGAAQESPSMSRFNGLEELFTGKQTY